MFRVLRVPSKRFSSSQVAWPSYEQTMTKKSFHERQHAFGTTRMWWWFNIVLTAPCLIATAVYTIPPEITHIDHLKHHPNEWQGYSYMRKRTKVTHPWGGSNALFHSDYANAVPPADE